MDAEAVERILNGVGDGEPLRRILVDEKISPRIWYAALESDASLAERYARAKELAVDAMAEEILAISDDGFNDYKTVNLNGRDIEQLNAEHIQRSKLRVDTRKWLLSKLAPKKYGDKLTQEVTGGGGGAIVWNIMTGVPRNGDDPGSESS